MIGPDISNWQKIIDFNILKDNVDFIILKASEGIGFTDPKLITNQSEARGVGLLLGYYHFARPDLGNTPEGEALWFLKTIGKIYPGEVLFLDYEANWNGDVAGWCEKWLDTISLKLGGYKPLIYLNQSLVKAHNWSLIINKDYGLWLAKYDYDPNAPVPPLPWPVVAFRQYSNEAVFSGIQGKVDANVFYGDADAFRHYGYKASGNNCEEELAKAQSEYNKLQDDFINLKKEFEKLKADYKIMEKKYISDLDSKQEHIESLQKTGAEMTAQLSSMQKSYQTLQDQLKANLEAHNVLQGQSKEYHSVMEPKLLLSEQFYQQSLETIRKRDLEVSELKQRIAGQIKGYSWFRLLIELIIRPFSR